MLTLVASTTGGRSARAEDGDGDATVAPIATTTVALASDVRTTTTATRAPTWAAAITSSTAPLAVEVAPPPSADEASLAPVHVVASRVAGDARRAARHTDTIDRAEIERSGARDVAALLSTQGGLDIERSFRGAAIRMSGLEPEHTLVLIDGTPMVGRVDGVLDLSRLSLADVERIEIVRGASSALHGADALAGVIEITTRRPKRGLDVEVDLVGRSMPALIDSTTPGVDGRARLAWAGEGMRAKLRAGVDRDDPFDLDPSTPDTSGAGHVGFEMGGEGEYDVDPDLRLAARASYLRRDSNGVDLGTGGALFDRTSAVETLDVGTEVRAFLAPGRRLDGSVVWSLYRSQSLLDQRGDDDGDTYNDTHQNQVVARLVWGERFGTDHKLAVGVEGTMEQVSSGRLRDGGSDRYRASVFAEHGWTLSEDPRLLVVPGVRLDVDSTFGTHATPQLSLRADPIPAVILRASFGLGFRAPSFQEQLFDFDNRAVGYRVLGNPDVGPETSRSWTVRAEYLPVEEVTLAVGGYWNDVDDLIDYAVVSAPGGPLVFQVVNVAAARTRGVELSAGVDVPIDETWRVGGKASYNLLGADDLTTDRALYGRSTHQIAGEARIEIVPIGLQLSTRATWWSERAYDSGDPAAPSVLDPYAMLSARAALTFFEDRITLEVGLENALDAGDASLLLIRPRTLFAGITGRI